MDKARAIEAPPCQIRASRLSLAVPWLQMQSQVKLDTLASLCFLFDVDLFLASP